MKGFRASARSDRSTIAAAPFKADCSLVTLAISLLRGTSVSVRVSKLGPESRFFRFELG